jgi:hypothetical protein
MEKDLENLIIDFLIGVVFIGLLTILFKVIEFVLKRLFAFFRF